MAELKGTQVAAIVVPFTDADKYATHDAEYGKGGFRSVETIALRDAISTERKTKGMVVRVNETGLHYYWNGSAWTEWLPKGTMLVDAMFDINSTNPVQNKVITTRINEHAAKFDDIYSKIENIPTITIDTALSTTSTNPVQNKVITARAQQIEDTVNVLTAIVQEIPIITVDTTWNATSNNPASSKAIESAISPIRTTANSANAKAEAAIPKSWIDSSINGTETSNNSVPGTGAIVAYIKNNNTGLSTQISNTNSRVTNLESWKNTIGTKGAANGVASLDSGGKIPASQLPAGYDNVDMLQSFVTTNPSSNMQIGQKFYNKTTKKIFTATSATTGVETAVEGGDKIYINITENKSYRWTGATMVAVGDGSGVALGTTSSTAFRGDYGNTLYTNFGSGTNLQGTKDARDFFYNMSLFNSLENTSILKNLVVQPEANFVRLQNDIVYLIGEVNTGDGYDIPAATTTKAGVMTADMYKTLQEIEKAVFQLELSVVPSRDQTFEVGSDYTPTISLLVKRKGTNITQSASISVVGNPSLSGTLSSDHQQWVPSKAVSVNQKLTITATYNGQSVSKVYNIYFKYKKYWGVSTSASLTSSQVIALAGSTWADSKAMGATTFDCTGGKYVYYVIPDVLGTPEFWVGGLKNTDINVGNITVTNASGGSARYLIMRLANIQTGVLSVEFK